MRIVFGLCNTLIDYENFGYDVYIKFRPGVVELLKYIKNQKHILILWTSKNKSYIEKIKNNHKDFFDFFNEIYCKEDLDLVEDVPGCSLHIFKNINKINADCLIESKRSYERYSKILQMGNRYFIIEKFYDFLFEEPTKWQIKVLGSNVIERRTRRRKEKENWTFNVLDFLESLERKDTENS